MGRKFRFPGKTIMVSAKEWYSYMFLLLLMFESSSEAWGNPISHPSATGAFLPTDIFKARVKRYCSNEVHLLMLGACNKNHKRSPVIMSMIYVEYYMPPEIWSNNNRGHHSDGIVPEDLWIIAYDTINDNSEVIWDTEADTHWLEEELGDLGSDHTKNRNGISRSSHGARSKRLPHAAAHIYSIMDKCCSPVGCTELDFLSHCH